MKAMLSALSLTTVVAGGATLATMRARVPLTEPDKVLEIAPTALTTFLPPTNTTSMMQDVRPRIGQRGTQIDGAVRAGTGHGLAIGANPFAHGSGTSVKANGLRLDQGTYEIFDVDLRLPSTGIDWVVGRSYNARQVDASGTHLDSDGYQGKNWFQTSNPEVLLYDADANSGTEQAGDILYLIYGADRFLEFKRIADSKTIFRGVNGAAGVVQHAKDASSEPGTYVYTDQVGNQTYFFDNDGNAGAAAGQLWKLVDPAGNVAFFGHATTASTAISTGYTSGKPSVAYDASNRRYSYSYSSGLISQVVADILTSGTWASSPVTATVGKVEYSYHDGLDSFGTAGDLKVVKITTPLTDSGIDLVQRKYYRYYQSTYSSPSNLGQAHLIKLIVGFEGCRKYDYSDVTFDEDFLAESTANLEPYAEAFFEYDGSQRIVSSFSHGGCGCGGGSGDGIFDYEYETNGSYSNDTSGYDEDEYLGRTIVKRPDNAYETHYYDEAFQPLSYVLTDGDPDNTGPQPSLWATYVDRNSAGIVLEVSTPANVTAYTHSSASFTRSSSAGLVWTYDLVGSSYTTEGFATDRKFKEAGTSGTAYFDRTWTYDFTSYQVDGGETDSQVIRPVVATDREYADKISGGTSGSNLWSYAYTWHGASGTDLLALARLDTTEPAVTTGKNGSNSSNLTRKYWNKDGTLGFEKTALGYITYHGYTSGQQVTLIEDVDTAHGDLSGVTIPTNFSSSGTELHRKSTFTYDNQGRPSTTTANSYTPVRYYSRLKDQRPVVLGFTHSVAGSPTTYYGPASYAVSNQAGSGEVSGVIGLSSNSTTSALTGLIDETDDDPITAVDVGTVKRLTTSHYDLAGHELSESRLYFAIPGSEPGTDATHYDPTTFAYDDMGRRIRTEAPHGTVERNDYDVRGQVTASWIGTNDNGSAGGDVSGTANMVKTSAVVYDAGADKGNGYVTTATDYVQDSTTNQRVTTYTNDARGRTILEARPTTPHYLHKYDNLGRRIATGLFSSTSGLSASSDPTSATSNRLALSESSYDELGRVWRTTAHEIDDTDGSDDDTLTADSWFDADGQVIKVDGAELAKSIYDRLGRQTHHFNLARVTDSTYADADDLTSDIVLEESQTTYDSSDGNVIMRALIQRFHDDLSTTGPLDTNADTDVLAYTAADVDGRIQITAYWNGLQGVSDQVEYGTYGGSTFDRDGLSVPSRSTTALRTSFTYNTDGTLSTVQDPEADTSHVTKYEYDAAGRKTKEIRHYDAGVNSGNPDGDDDNVTTAWAWSRTAGVVGYTATMTADLPSNDQVTTYTYGTTKGASVPDSKIATGHLLLKVAYPDSSDSGDVVKHAYNAQGQLIYKKDQEPSGHTANVLQFNYDESGRQTHQRVTTLGTGVDGAVRRITTVYNDLGQVARVRQYDDPTAGSGNIVNDVKFVYNGWGLIQKYEEDRDSAVDAGGSLNDYGLLYTYAKATAGRNTLRRTSMAMGYGTAAGYEMVSYEYVTTNSFDNDVSRVTKVKDGFVALATYEYLGAGHVVGTDYAQASVNSGVHTATPGDYADLDRFNRPTTNKWTKDLSVDKHFFNTTIAWDEVGNVTSVDEGVHGGFDVKYSMDDLDRVYRAQEGTLSGGSIGTETREQEWTLTHTGNWANEKLDLNGDGDWGDADEHNDTRAHNDVNEIMTQNLDSTGGVEATLAYDPSGNMTDDGQSYKYIYDAFYRLRKITDQSDNLVEEMTYNGLGHLICEHYDHDRSAGDGVPDGTVDSYDEKYYTAYDERWRAVATFRDADTTPKEIFWLQQAGADGDGGSSYINGVVARYKDANTAWTAASDGTLEQVHYYAQNWRGDVVGLVDDSGSMAEWVKYTAYGLAFGLPKGDGDSDGDCDSIDANTVIQGWINLATYDARGDLDLDGDVDSADKASALAGACSIGSGQISGVGSSRVDLQACKLEYSIVSPK